MDSLTIATAQVEPPGIGDCQEPISVEAARASEGQILGDVADVPPPGFLRDGVASIPAVVPEKSTLENLTKHWSTPFVRFKHNILASAESTLLGKWRVATECQVSPLDTDDSGRV
jgi:hypothetical protein